MGAVDRPWVLLTGCGGRGQAVGAVDRPWGLLTGRGGRQQAMGLLTGHGGHVGLLTSCRGCVQGWVEPQIDVVYDSLRSF